MLPLIRSLFAHQAWADAMLLTAVRAHPGAVDDPELRTALHHIIVVQRFFRMQVEGHPFDETDMKEPESFDALIAKYRHNYAATAPFLDGLGEADLPRLLEKPPLEKLKPSVGVALTQVVMHSQGHRSQCLTRLRVLGAKPPTLDYILWVKDRPAPDWPA